MTRAASIWPRTVFACALMALLVSLGCWQLDRADQKRALRSAFDLQVEAPAMDLALHGVEPVTNHAWRAVTAAGRYEPPVLLLDNRVRDGRIGYEVLTAFRLEDGTRILVDRGWLVAGATRTELPTIPVPTDVTALHGRLAPAPSTGLVMGDAAAPESLGPDFWRLQHIDFAVLERKFAPGFLPMLVYLDATEPAGYDRNWILPAPDDGKHTAYAVQWFAMAGAVAILLGISLRRSLTTPKSDQDP